MEMEKLLFPINGFSAISSTNFSDICKQPQKQMETEFLQPATLPSFTAMAYNELLRLASTLFKNEPSGFQENQPLNLASFSVDTSLQISQETCQPAGMCTICRVEEATVSHFNVDVCTGCRAFFRRSVAQQKIYRCLNSKLCGKNNLVPNRRVCKFCRFQRCIDAGMLKSKVQMYWQKLEADLRSPSPMATSSISPSSSISPRGYAPISESNTILDQFLLLRRKITYERLQNFYGNQPRSDGEADFQTNVAFVMSEGQLLLKILGRSGTFEGLNDVDRTIIFAQYFAEWISIEQCLANARFSAYCNKKCYHANGASFMLTEDGAYSYWRPIMNMIKKDQPAIFTIIVEFFLHMALYMSGTVASEIAKAALSEEELAALTALVFTRQEIIGMVSEEGKKLLMNIRSDVLRNLSIYHQSTGQNVQERMSVIIFLITHLQSFITLSKNGRDMLRISLDDETTPIFPVTYEKLLTKADRFIKSRQLLRLQFLQQSQPSSSMEWSQNDGHTERACEKDDVQRDQ